MRILVLYSTKSRPSARALAKRLSEYSENIKVNRGLAGSKLVKDLDYDVVLNVGNTTKHILKNNPPIINNQKNISSSANKRLARMRFKTRRIPSPELWLDYSKIPPVEYPVIGRTTYHMKAKGFWLCKDKKEAYQAQQQGATHFLKFIRNTREFRAHVFSTCLEPKSMNDYVIGKLSEKRGGASISGTVIKNHDNGYRFVAPLQHDLKVLDKVRLLAKKVLHSFKLHYGGVDIMYSEDTKRVYVLEINTTPCLTDDFSNTIDIYTDKILRMVGYDDPSQ